MIHAYLTDGRTILIGDNEPIEAKSNLLCAEIETVYNRFASELLAIEPERRRFVRVNFRNPWWPIRGSAASMTPNPSNPRRNPKCSPRANPNHTATTTGRLRSTARSTGRSGT